MKMQTYKDIDQYISMAPKERQDTLEKIRQTITKSAPGAEEAIKYGMPTFRFKGKNLVHFAVFKDHYGFYPTPTPIEEFKNELSAYSTSKGTVQFPLDKPIPYDLIQRIVKSRLQSL